MVAVILCWKSISFDWFSISFSGRSFFLIFLFDLSFFLIFLSFIDEGLEVQLVERSFTSHHKVVSYKWRFFNVKWKFFQQKFKILPLKDDGLCDRCFYCAAPRVRFRALFNSTKRALLVLFALFCTVLCWFCANNDRFDSQSHGKRCDLNTKVFIFYCRIFISESRIFILYKQQRGW